MNPDWDGVMKARARESKPAKAVRDVLRKTPELDKFAAVAQESQVIGAFLEWLDTHGRFVGQFYDGRAAPASIGTEALLAEYFEIDLKRVEQERRAILKAVRAAR